MRGQYTLEHASFSTTPAQKETYASGPYPMTGNPMTEKSDQTSGSSDEREWATRRALLQAVLVYLAHNGPTTWVTLYLHFDPGGTGEIGPALGYLAVNPTPNRDDVRLAALTPHFMLQKSSLSVGILPSDNKSTWICPGEGDGGRALHSPVTYKEFALENTKSPVSPSLSTEFTLQSYHHANNCG